MKQGQSCKLIPGLTPPGCTEGRRDSAGTDRRLEGSLGLRNVHILFGSERHPTSSAKFLYFVGPDGMVYAYSSGVREISHELLYRERQFPFGPIGFWQWGAKPELQAYT